MRVFYVSQANSKMERKEREGVSITNGTGDGSLLVGVGNGLAGKESGAAIGGLEYNRRLGLAGSL